MVAPTMVTRFNRGHGGRSRDCEQGAAGVQSGPEQAEVVPDGSTAPETARRGPRPHELGPRRPPSVHPGQGPRAVSRPAGGVVRPAVRQGRRLNSLRASVWTAQLRSLRRGPPRPRGWSTRVVDLVSQVRLLPGASREAAWLGVPRVGPDRGPALVLIGPRHRMVCSSSPPPQRLALSFPRPRPEQPCRRARTYTAVWSSTGGARSEGGRRYARVDAGALGSA